MDKKKGKAGSRAKKKHTDHRALIYFNYNIVIFPGESILLVLNALRFLYPKSW